MIEYFAIKGELIKLGRFEEFKEKAIEEYLTLKKDYPNECLRLETENLKPKEYFDDGVYSIKKKCLLLAEDKACLLYKVRPFICRFYRISSKYNTCNKVKRKCMKFFSKEESPGKVKKHLILIQYDEEYIINVDQFWDKGEIKLIRPYPLIFWLTNDFLYLNLYEDALQKSIEQFSMNL